MSLHVPGRLRLPRLALLTVGLILVVAGLPAMARAGTAARRHGRACPGAVIGHRRLGAHVPAVRERRRARCRGVHASRARLAHHRGSRGGAVRVTTSPTRAGTGTTATGSPAAPAAGSGPGGPDAGGSAGSGGSSASGLWVNPQDSAVTQANALRAAGDGAQADQLQAIADQPDATWLTDAQSGGQANVTALTAAAAAADQTPVFVVYDLPWRDCGQYSSGGAASPAAYQSFVQGVAAGIGTRSAIVIVEPDALSEMSCLPASEQAQYTSLLRYAVTQLTADPVAQVYVDAGNPGWQSASTEAADLRPVISGTDAGFAVNVSNFYPLSDDVTYGTAISGALGGTHFVVDTSRSGGNVAAGQWCNPAGARLGPDPTTQTGIPLLDAELWIKDPGESDGTCNGGPPAGQFWLSYALSLTGP